MVNGKKYSWIFIICSLQLASSNLEFKAAASNQGCMCTRAITPAAFSRMRTTTVGLTTNNLRAGAGTHVLAFVKSRCEARGLDRSVHQVKLIIDDH